MAGSLVPSRMAPCRLQPNTGPFRRSYRDVTACRAAPCLTHSLGSPQCSTGALAPGCSGRNTVRGCSYPRPSTARRGRSPQALHGGDTAEASRSPGDHSPDALPAAVRGSESSDTKRRARLCAVRGCTPVRRSRAQSERSGYAAGSPRSGLPDGHLPGDRHPREPPGRTRHYRTLRVPALLIDPAPRSARIVAEHPGSRRASLGSRRGPCGGRAAPQRGPRIERPTPRDAACRPRCARASAAPPEDSSRASSPASSNSPPTPSP